jgi:hypothetical protein
MIELFSISCGVALVLLVWMHSEAFLEYATFIGGSRFFLIDDFKDKQKSNPALDYIEYLQSHHNTFFIRLITCPLCFSVWLTLAACLFTDNLLIFPICNILSLIIYKITIKTLWS